MSEDHDKIRKLLALADAEVGKPEGETARRAAERKLAKLGLTREDIERAERIILDQHRTLWEDALLNLVTLAMRCDLIERSSEDGNGTFLIIAGGESHIGHVAQLFSALRTAVDNDAELYVRRTALTIPMIHKQNARFTFCGYAILGIATAWENNHSLDEEFEDPGATPPPRKVSGKPRDEPKHPGTEQHHDTQKKPSGPARPHPTQHGRLFGESREERKARSAHFQKDSLERLASHLERSSSAAAYDTGVEPSPEQAGFEEGILIGDEIRPRDYLGPKKITKTQGR